MPSYIVVYSKCLKTRCTGTCAWKRTSYSYKEFFLTWKTIRKSCFWVLWAFSNFSVSSSSCCCFLSNSSSRLGSGFDSPFASPGWKQQSKLLHYQETVRLILEVTLLPRDCYGLILEVTLLPRDCYGLILEVILLPRDCFGLILEVTLLTAHDIF